jgi:hypothetical protein
MEDVLQVVFLSMVCLFAGGLGTIAIVGVSILASRRAS